MSEKAYNSMSINELKVLLTEKRSELINLDPANKETYKVEYKSGGRGINAPDLREKLRLIDSKLKEKREDIKDINLKEKREKIEDINLNNKGNNTNYLQTLPPEILDKILEEVSSFNKNSSSNSSKLEEKLKLLNQEAELFSNQHKEPGVNQISNSDLKRRIKDKIEHHNNPNINDVSVNEQIKKNIEKNKQKKSEKRRKKLEKKKRFDTRKLLLN